MWALMPKWFWGAVGGALVAVAMIMAAVTYGEQKQRAESRAEALEAQERHRQGAQEIENETDDLDDAGLRGALGRLFGAD